MSNLEPNDNVVQKLKDVLSFAEQLEDPQDLKTYRRIEELRREIKDYLTEMDKRLKSEMITMIQSCPKHEDISLLLRHEIDGKDIKSMRHIMERVEKLFEELITKKHIKTLPDIMEKVEALLQSELSRVGMVSNEAFNNKIDKHIDDYALRKGIKNSESIKREYVEYIRLQTEDNITKSMINKWVVGIIVSMIIGGGGTTAWLYRTYSQIEQIEPLKVQLDSIRNKNSELIQLNTQMTKDIEIQRKIGEEQRVANVEMKKEFDGIKSSVQFLQQSILNLQDKSKSSGGNLPEMK